MGNSIAEIKNALHQYIASTDNEKLLIQVQQYVRNLIEKEDQVIGYNSNGDALTVELFKQRLDQAIEEADEGNVISQEDMEKGL